MVYYINPYNGLIADLEFSWPSPFPPEIFSLEFLDPSTHIDNLQLKVNGCFGAVGGLGFPLDPRKWKGKQLLRGITIRGPQRTV